MKIYYRISDKGKTSGKPEYIHNEACLNNFLMHFSECDITFVADNCTDRTLNWLRKLGREIITTRLGNAGSCLYTIDIALQQCRDDEFVYFVEADYLHRFDSYKVLQEGLARFDYVTLYDHPDKYLIKSPNPYVKDGGEETKVYLTKSTHWKRTNSTTMTFAVKISTLRKDRDVFAEYCNHRKIPDDFGCFTTLSYQHNRVLVSSIPGYSTHGESVYLSPLTDWASVGYMYTPIIKI